MPLTLDRFVLEDLPGFLALATAEGWLCDQWEFQFLLHQPLAGCFVIRKDLQPFAYITAINYGAAGWIGNLIVAPEYRQQGLGRWLMQTAITFLDEARTECIWLTASQQGAPLYAQLGFQQIDRINRWVGSGSGELAVRPAALNFKEISACDAAGWGTPRTSLLQEKARLSDGWQNAGGFVMRHQNDSGTQIGPWGGIPDAAAALFPYALADQKGKRIFLDAPATNLHAAELFASHGMSCHGESVLMYRGDASNYSSTHVFALGTMGSVG